MTILDILLLAVPTLGVVYGFGLMFWLLLFGPSLGGVVPCPAPPDAAFGASRNVIDITPRHN